MNNILKEAAQIIARPSCIIKTPGSQLSLTKAALIVLLAAGSAAPVMAQNAPMSPGASQESAALYEVPVSRFDGSDTIFVRDQVHENMQRLGFAFDSGTREYNYTAYGFNRINDYLFYAHEHYSPDKFEQVKELVSIANQHFKENPYKEMMFYARYDARTIREHITMINDGSNHHAEHVQQLLKINELFALMADEPGFHFDPKADLNEVSEDLAELATLKGDQAGSSSAEVSGEYLISVTSKDKIENLEMSPYRRLYFLASNFDAHNTFVYTPERNREVSEYMTVAQKAYGLNEKDKDLVSGVAYPHEVGHTYRVANGGVWRELGAQVLANWALVQSGLSENGLKYSVDRDTEYYGAISNITDPHAVQGLERTFYKQFSFDEIKSMSIDAMMGQLEKFEKRLPAQLDESVVGYVTANAEMKRTGVQPVVREYLERTGEHPEFLDMLKKANNNLDNPNAAHYFSQQSQLSQEHAFNGFTSRLGSLFPQMTFGSGEISNRALTADMMLRFSDALQNTSGNSDYQLTANLELSDFAKMKTDFPLKGPVKVIGNTYYVEDSLGQFESYNYNVQEGKSEISGGKLTLTVYGNDGPQSYIFTKDGAGYRQSETGQLSSITDQDIKQLKEQGHTVTATLAASYSPSLGQQYDRVLLNGEVKSVREPPQASMPISNKNRVTKTADADLSM